ncbi:MAG: AAA family ATPase [Tabrizicola sp.]|jgi:hypothetical protein|nr:AAA family ATPase [Tabrizicola sp.]
MKLRHLKIHNFRSIKDASVGVSDYTLLVGANNAGKSNLLAALRMFYDDLKWSKSDEPKLADVDSESWIELAFILTEAEWDTLADKYKEGVDDRTLRVRRYFRSAERVKTNQSNMYGYVNGSLEDELFYGAKNVGNSKLGQVIYIPALTTADEQTKLSGPSPLREVLNFLLKKVVGGSKTYAALVDAFSKLNQEAKDEQGFLNEVSKPLNDAIAAWNIKIDLNINNLKPEDISKNLVSFSFLDSALGDASFDLAKYGHGFQRSVIYELIRIAPSFRDVKVSDKKEFSPDFTLILFEEPEAFLHPAQQENMSYHLRKLSAEATQQVMLCTHSSIFAGKAAEDIQQIVRLYREHGETKVQQAHSADVKAIFSEGGQLFAALQAFVSDARIPDSSKKNAKSMIANPPQQQIAEAEERFRFQLWLDGDRSSLFFADRVLLVEGATERALFSYLLADQWHDLCHHRICVVDVLGKYNFHRYMSLFKAFQIPYGIILDDDNGKDHHQAVNELVDALAARSESAILALPEKVPDCLEVFLGLPKVTGSDHKKPIEIMKAVTSGSIAKTRLEDLRAMFKRSLALT